jgi:hypothetical protein
LAFEDAEWDVATELQLLKKVGQFNEKIISRHDEDVYSTVNCLSKQKYDEQLQSVLRH